MLRTFVLKHKKPLWQAAFLISGSTWLFAPYLNDLLSSRRSLISEYKVPGQPYFWLYYTGDIMAGLLVIGAAYYVYKRRALPRSIVAAIAAIGLLMAVDSLAPATCHVVGDKCTEYISFTLIVHAVETVLLAAIIFGCSLWDGLRRKSLMSMLFVAFQAADGLLFLISVGRVNSLGTITQYSFQLLTAVWLAWWIGSLITPEATLPRNLKQVQTIRNTVAIWAYGNGVVAILIGLLHTSVPGVIDRFYIENDTAWLSQHTVVAGLLMLYLSRHLARGEHRARLVFLGLLFVEMVKYAVVNPSPALVVAYGVSFVVLFCLKPLYYRGSKRLNGNFRWQEILTVVSGASLALSGLLLLYANNPAFARTIQRTFAEFYEYIALYKDVPASALQSALLAHTLTALLAGMLVFVLWSLFRPSVTATDALRPSNIDRGEARELLLRFSSSSEDYFKLWPEDKSYFWNSERTGFIAYKRSGAVIFGLADPVTSSGRSCESLLKTFVLYWQQHGCSVCFIAVDEPSLPMYEHQGLRRLQTGSSALIDIQQFSTTTVRNKWWRWQMNRGKRHGYSYGVSQPPHAIGLLSQARAVSDAWLQRPGHREQGFALGYFDEAYLNQCELHYVYDSSDNMVAFANQLPVFSNQRRTTVDLIRFDPDASNAMPFLLANTIQHLAGQGLYDSFDLGFVPLAKAGSAIAKTIRAVARNRYSSSGLEQFKDKFEPAWSKSYLVYSGDIGDLATIGLQLEAVLSQKA